MFPGFISWGKQKGRMNYHIKRSQKEDEGRRVERNLGGAVVGRKKKGVPHLALYWRN